MSRFWRVAFVAATLAGCERAAPTAAPAASATEERSDKAEGVAAVSTYRKAFERAQKAIGPEDAAERLLELEREVELHAQERE